MPYAEQAWANGSGGGTPISADRLAYMEQGINDASYAAQGVLLDSFQNSAGSLSDDQMLTAAMSYAAAQTRPPAIKLYNRAYSFPTSGRQPYTGFRLIGPPGYSNPEKSAVNQASLITLGGGTWLDNSTSSLFNVGLENLCIKGTSSTVVMAGTGSYYCLQLRDLYVSNVSSTLGKPSQKLLITAAQFDGSWEVNNNYNTAFHLGGSDNTLWPAGMLIDSGVAYNNSSGAVGDPHLWCNGLDKTSIGPLYMTTEGPWGGILVDGAAIGSSSTNQGVLWFHTGLRVEGRNPGQPCNGANIRVRGGNVSISQAWIGYGMSSPASQGHTPTDGAMIDVTGGYCTINDCTYDRATGVAESVYFARVGSGAVLDVSHIKPATRGGSWSGKPRVLNNGGTLISDSTVAVY